MSRSKERKSSYKKRSSSKPRMKRMKPVSTVSAKKYRLMNAVVKSAWARDGQEIKNRYTTMASSASGAIGQIVFDNPDVFTNQRVFVNQIPVGSGSSQRIGRLVKLRSFQFRYAVAAPVNGQGGSIRMVIVFDKRPERTQSLTWADCFTGTGGSNVSYGALNALYRETNDGRFEYLYDKTVTVEGSRVSNPLNGNFVSDAITNTRNVATGMEMIDLSASKFYTQYSSTGTNGFETDVEYGALHFIYWSEITAENGVSLGAQAPRMNCWSELRWVEEK